MKRRIKRAKITFVSLCPKGKNGMPVLYKSDDSTVQIDTLIKASADFAEHGELTAIAYAPEIEDKDGDVASAEVIKKMAYDYARDGGRLDIRHDGKPLDNKQAFVAEQFIVQKDDPRFADMTDYEGSKVDVTGAWAMVIKVDDEDLRKKYREEDWNGVSIFGTAEVEERKSDDDFVARVTKALASLKGENTEEIEMKAEELLKALGENNTVLAETIVKALKPEPKTALKTDLKPDDKSAEALVFKGDPTDPKAVEKYLLEVKKTELQKSVDWTDPEAVAAHLKTLAKEDADDDKDSDESDEVKALRKEKDDAEKKLKKALSGSGQTKSDEGEGETTEGISKAENDLFKTGKSIGELSNQSRGFAKV